MHEAITIAKVRKACTVKVPAGGWIIIATPDQPFNEHALARGKLVNAGEKNEQYERVVCGRLDNKYRTVIFVTEADIARQQKEAADADASVKRAIASSAKLQKDRNAADQAREKAAHEKAVADANVVNATIANREFNGASHKEIPVPNAILTESEEASEAAAEKAAAEKAAAEKAAAEKAAAEKAAADAQTGGNQENQNNQP